MGGLCPSASLWRPPDNGFEPLSDLGKVSASCAQENVFVSRLCIVCVCVLSAVFVSILWKRLKASPATGQPSLFRVPGRICFGVGQMFFGGGSHSGGCFGTLGATVPQNDSLKDRGGPRHPSCHLPNLDLQSCLVDESY